MAFSSGKSYNNSMNRYEQAETDSNSSASQWDMNDVTFAGDKIDTEQNDESEKPPKYLFRGITVPFETFSGLDLDGDLVPNKPPIINERGRETVEDGNEYGVYMTDNEQMTKDVYGNPDHKTGKEIGTIPLLFGDKIKITEPYIGVIYKIDTEGTDVHRPWISDALKGHYNNGYEGEEWVSLNLPKDSYEVSAITIGSDILHDKEDCTSKTKEEITQRYAERRQHLERLYSDLGQSMPKDLKTLTPFMLKRRLKELYGDDGLAYKEKTDTKSK